MNWVLYVVILALEWYTVLIVPTKGNKFIIRHYVGLLIGFAVLLTMTFVVMILIKMGINIPMKVIPLSLVGSINLMFIAVIGLCPKLFLLLLRGVTRHLEENEPKFVASYFSLFEKLIKIFSCLVGVLIFYGSVVLMYSDLVVKMWLQ